MTKVQKHIGMLGLKVRDKVTGCQGVVASMSFDLYGCVQALVDPGMKQDGELANGRWMDVCRLQVLDSNPVMPAPDFESGPIADGLHGPAEKPTPARA